MKNLLSEMIIGKLAKGRKIKIKLPQNAQEQIPENIQKIQEEIKPAAQTLKEKTNLKGDCFQFKIKDSINNGTKGTIELSHEDSSKIFEGLFDL